MLLWAYGANPGQTEAHYVLPIAKKQRMKAEGGSFILATHCLVP